MKQTSSLILFALFILISGCAGSKPPETTADVEKNILPPLPVWTFNYQPKKNTLLFLGIADRMKSREDEYEKALQFASIQAAMFSEVGGRFRSLTHETNSLFGRREDGEIFYSPETAWDMYENLKEENRFQNDQFTLVLFSLEIKNSLPRIESRNGNKIPEWISIPPFFEGYLTGVAMVEPHRTFSETAKAADNRVLRELLSQRELRITGEHTHSNKVSETRSSSDSDDSLFQGTSGSLYGFYILARWEDPKGRLYSLGICPIEN